MEPNAGLVDYVYLSIGFFILVIEFLLGKTKKFAANSILEAILNICKGIVSKEKKTDKDAL